MKGFTYKGKIYKLVKAMEHNECIGCAFHDNKNMDCIDEGITKVWYCGSDEDHIAEDVTETLIKL